MSENALENCTRSRTSVQVHAFCGVDIHVQMEGAQRGPDRVQHARDLLAVVALVEEQLPRGRRAEREVLHAGHGDSSEQPVDEGPREVAAVRDIHWGAMQQRDCAEGKPGPGMRDRDKLDA